jgi:hypothetical protein
MVAGRARAKQGLKARLGFPPEITYSGLVTRFRSSTLSAPATEAGNR